MKFDIFHLLFILQILIISIARPNQQGQLRRTFNTKISKKDCKVKQATIFKVYSIIQFIITFTALWCAKNVFLSVHNFYLFYSYLSLLTVLLYRTVVFAYTNFI